MHSLTIAFYMSMLADETVGPILQQLNGH